MSGTKALCSVYATLYQKCLQGYKTDHVKTCEDYVFFESFWLCLSLLIFSTWIKIIKNIN